ncbi:unnamed protein product [Lactuca saligna]|uniref:Uncharacterized protein n=1 Tax=Lactuca saligna TaxID=75948 RepID=A0AA36EP27_LACSI|nr:unnamed protein product [Lactuca saligna]
MLTHTDILFLFLFKVESSSRQQCYEEAIATDEELKHDIEEELIIRKKSKEDGCYFFLPRYIDMCMLVTELIFLPHKESSEELTKWKESYSKVMERVLPFHF